MTTNESKPNGEELAWMLNEQAQGDVDRLRADLAAMTERAKKSEAMLRDRGVIESLAKKILDAAVSLDVSELARAVLRAEKAERELEAIRKVRDLSAKLDQLRPAWTHCEERGEQCETCQTRKDLTAALDATKVSK